MGKKTKVIYFCDICESTMDDDLLNKCDKCGAEVCSDCSEKAELEFSIKETELRKTDETYCTECLNGELTENKIIDILADKLIRTIGSTSLETSD